MPGSIIFLMTLLTEILSTVISYFLKEVIILKSFDSVFAIIPCKKKVQVLAAMFPLCCICLNLLTPLSVSFEDFDLRLRHFRIIFGSSLQVG